jgi:hypothetical protein
MPKKKATAKKTLLSQKRIAEITRDLRKRVSEHRQKQNEGILPFYKRIPITVMEIGHVMLIIRRTRSTAQKLMREIRLELGKKPRQKVSVTEFCNKTGIPIEDVRDALNLLT